MVEEKVSKVEEKVSKKVEKVKEESSAKEQLKEMEKVIEGKEKAKEEVVQKEAEEKFKKEERRGGRVRETREARFAREEREKLDKWVPRTALGREARTGKIKDIDEVFARGIKILEPQIVDLLIPGLMKDTLFIGQAKGKFGGGKRRAFRQTQKKTKEGNVLTFGVMAVVGDGKGHLGIGYGRAAETLPAKEKALRKAKLNIMKIPRGCGSFDDISDDPHSIPVSVEGKCSSVKIKLMPAPNGTGLVCGDELKKIFKAAGIKDIYSKTYGKTRTTFNAAKACVDALSKLGDIER